MLWKSASLRPPIGGEFTTSINYITLSELEFGEALSLGASLQTQHLRLGAILPIMGKGFEAFRLRQARPRVAVRRGKRAEQTHASAYREQRER